MLLDFIFFPLFLCMLYIVGAGILRARPKEAEIYPTYFYFVIACMTIGFLAVLFNFFTGVYSLYYYLILALIFVVGIRRLRWADVSEIKQFMLLGLLLTPITIAMRSQADAGLYHLPHQLWIRDEKIVFGLANFHSRFGFSSFLEYISAPLWIGEHFKLLAYLIGAFILVLLLFLRDITASKNPLIATVGFLTLAGLLINSNYLDFEYTSTDTPAGILFAMAFFHGLFLLLENGQTSKKALGVFFLLSLFAFMLKGSNVTIALWTAFVVGKLFLAKRVVLITLCKVSLLPVLLTVLWLARSVLTSGCLLYPLASSCLDVTWSARDKAIENAYGITIWARHPRGGNFPLSDWSWLMDWWVPHQWVFCLGILFTLMLVAGVYRYTFQTAVERGRSIILPALAFVLLALGIWFYKAPTPRFGMGMFIILPVVAALSIFGFRDNFTLRNIRQKNMRKIGGVLIILLACKFSIVDLGKAVYHGKFAFNSLPAPAVEILPDPNFGVKPAKDLCWTAKYCGWDDRPGIRELYGYRYFAY